MTYALTERTIMRYKILALCALALPTAASAADLGHGGMKDGDTDVVYGAGPVAGSSYHWTGFYVGGSLGFSQTNADVSGSRREYDKATGYTYTGTDTIYKNAVGTNCGDVITAGCHKAGDIVPTTDTAPTNVLKPGEVVPAIPTGITSTSAFTPVAELNGVAIFDKNGHNLYAPTGTSTSILGLDAGDGSGVTGGVHFGYDYQFGHFVAGVMGDAMLRGGSTSISGDSGRKYSFDQSSSFFLGGRLGALVTDKTLIYGLAGYTWLNYDNFGKYGDLQALDPATHNVDKSGRSYSYGDDNVGMWTVGGGVETVVMPKITLGVEARYSWSTGDHKLYSESLVDSAGNLAASTDVSGKFDDFTVLGKLSYKLN